MATGLKSVKVWVRIPPGVLFGKSMIDLKKSLMKTLSWRVISFILTLILSYFFLRSTKESLTFTLIYGIISAIVFFVHEIIWDLKEETKMNSLIKTVSLVRYYITVMIHTKSDETYKEYLNKAFQELSDMILEDPIEGSILIPFQVYFLEQPIPGEQLDLMLKILNRILWHNDLTTEMVEKALSEGYSAVLTEK